MLNEYKEHSVSNRTSVILRKHDRVLHLEGRAAYLLRMIHSEFIKRSTVSALKKQETNNFHQQMNILDKKLTSSSRSLSRSSRIFSLASLETGSSVEFF